MVYGYKVIQELRWNGVRHRYLVEHTVAGTYSIHASFTKLSVGDTLNTCMRIAHGSKKYLLKTYN